MTRACDGCTVCCQAPAIPEDRDEGTGAAHPAGVMCQHATTTGCAIYETRPGICRAFECAWLSGTMGEDTDHPPACGYMWFVSAGGVRMWVTRSDAMPAAMARLSGMADVALRLACSSPAVVARSCGAMVAQLAWAPLVDELAVEACPDCGHVGLEAGAQAWSRRCPQCGCDFFAARAKSLQPETVARLVEMTEILEAAVDALPQDG